MESENIEESGKKLEVSILHIINIDFRHVGEYKCHAVAINRSEIDFARIDLNVTLVPVVVQLSDPVKVALHQNVTLFCIVEGYPLISSVWMKDRESINFDYVAVKALNDTVKNVTISLRELTTKDNGTYTCSASNGLESTSKTTAVLVLDKPKVNIDFVKAIGKSKIYLNWTVNDGNEPESLHYRIQYMNPSDKSWIYYRHEVGGGNRSYVLADIFNKDTEYTLRMMAYNSEGESQYSNSDLVRTLSEDPIHIPEVKVTGVTVTSITISWTGPPTELKDHVHYYQLISHAGNLTDPMETVHLASKENLYMFSDLDPATTYNFQVAACNEYSHQCGPWSSRVNGTTMDGISSPPENVSVECKFDNISQTSFVIVAWKPPIKPHGTITSYNVSSL